MLEVCCIDSCNDGCYILNIGCIGGCDEMMVLCLKYVDFHGCDDGRAAINVCCINVVM